MEFEIIQFDGAHRKVDVDAWKGFPLSAVSDHAKELVDLNIAERVEVRDTSGKLVFHWPRTLRPAVPPQKNS